MDSITSINSADNRQYEIGVTYLVTNSKGTTSILMGTCHAIDAKSLQNPCIQTILKCSALFTEMGHRRFFCSNDGCFPGVEKHEIPYPHAMDSFLTILAGWRKIPITGLDCHVPAHQDFFVRMEAQLTRAGEAERRGDLVAKNRLIQQNDPASLAPLSFFVQSFQQGNLDVLKKYRVMQMSKDGISGVKREEKWSEILIPKLQEADKPIGIAVGAAHLVGEDGLAERFAKAGLKVELITPSPRSLL